MLVLARPLYVPASSSGSSASTLKVAVATEVYVFVFLPTFSVFFIVKVTVYMPAFDAVPTMAVPFQERPVGSPVTDASFQPFVANTSTPRSASVTLVFMPPSAV